MKLFSVLIATCSLPLAAHAQQLLGTATGQTNERFGAALADAGDQNGDGVSDVLVGAPGANNGNGVVHCVSGAFLATGNGTSVLFTLTPGTTAGTAYGFGSSVVNIGDLTGDGIADFAVGAPDLDYMPVGVNSGAVYLIDGATRWQHSLVWGGVANQRFGSCLAKVGDVTGDGKSELAVGAPGVYAQLSGGVSVLSGSGLAAAGSSGSMALSVTVGANSGEAGFGTSIASGFDLDNDGSNDIAIGSPFVNGTGAPESGAVWIMRALSPAPGQVAHIFAWYVSPVAFEHLGSSIAAAHDYNGDGVVDIIAGAPDKIVGVNAQEGRAVVLDGANVNSNTAPKELYVFNAISPNPAPTNLHFGAAVCASADLNNDGVGDILIGIPDYSVTFPSGPGRGGVSIYSGATGVRIGGLTGSNQERLGGALLGAFDDLDGDGYPDFAVGGPLGDNPTADCGKVKAYRLFPSFPSSYCTAKVNSLGCTPTISWNGTASATSPTPFTVTCVNMLNQRVGFLTYSHQPDATPFQGGFRCISAPIKRTPAQVSGGSATGSDCTGVYSLDFNARIQSGIDPTLVPGSEVFAQYRSRDPLASFSTSLSNGLRFMVNP